MDFYNLINDIYIVCMSSFNWFLRFYWQLLIRIGLKQPFYNYFHFIETSAYIDKQVLISMCNGHSVIHSNSQNKMCFSSHKELSQSDFLSVQNIGLFEEGFKNTLLGTNKLNTMYEYWKPEKAKIIQITYCIQLNKRTVNIKVFQNPRPSRKQHRSRLAGFIRSQLIKIHTVFHPHEESILIRLWN